MLTSDKIRQEIQVRIKDIPQARLEDILNYIKELEEEKNSDIMEYCGLWSDMDENTLEELTTALPEKRKN